MLYCICRKRSDRRTNPTPAAGLPAICHFGCRTTRRLAARRVREEAGCAPAVSIGKWLRPSARPWQIISYFPSRGLRAATWAGAQAATKESSPEERGEDRRHPAWQPHRRSNQPWTRLRHSSDQEEALDVWLGSEGGTRTAARPVQDAPAVDLRGGASVDAPLYHGSCLSFLKRSALTLLSGAPPPRPSVPVGRGRSALLVLSARPACSGETAALRSK